MGVELMTALFTGANTLMLLKIIINDLHQLRQALDRHLLNHIATK